MVKYSFVIPCYNSARSIEHVVNEIFSTMENIDPSFEVVLVNDYSKDETEKIIFDLAHRYPNVKAITFSENFGQHAALMAGYRAAEGDFTISMDDDGQTPADQVGKLIEELSKGYDVVFARYRTPKETLFRRIGSTVNSLMAEYLLGKPKDLSLTSFFISRKPIIDEVIQYQKAYPYIAGQILRATDNISNVFIDHRERIFGRSGYSIFKLIHLWLNGATIVSLRPLKLILLASFCFSLCCIMAGIWSLTRKAVCFAILLLLAAAAGIYVTLFLYKEYKDRAEAEKSGRPQYMIKNQSSPDE